MLYLLAIVFPPAAIWLSGKPGWALLNAGAVLFLSLMLPALVGRYAFWMTLLFVVWAPAILHAVLIVSSHRADQRAAAARANDRPHPADLIHAP